jgi:hypothetical protein
MEERIVTALSHEQQSELKALWHSRDFRAWFARLQEIAPEELEKLPSFMRDAFLKLNDNQDNCFAIYVPPECAPEKLAHYEVAPDDELVVDLPYRDKASGETRFEQGTAAMLRQLVELAERDPKIVYLVMEYWEALQKGEELKQEVGGDELWLSLLEAYDHLLANVFGHGNGRGRVGVKLLNISIHMIRTHVLSNREA